MLDAPHVNLEDPSLYFSQETSWLKFNERVLNEAADTRHPLLERLKFLAIFSNNLDEYFMVRVAALKQQLEAEVTRRSVDGRLPAEQLVALAQLLRPMLDRHMTILRYDVLTALEKHDIRVIPYQKLPGMTQARLRELFIENVFPVLTPLAVDHTHPFPYISNLSLSLAVEIEDQADSTIHSFARVKVPGSLPRFVPLGEGHPHHYVLFEELIAGNLDLLFPGMTVIAAWPFRATRDADLDLQEDEAHDLLSAIESELRRRRYGEPARLEVYAGMPENVRQKLLDALDLNPEDCYATNGPLAISDYLALASCIDIPELHDPPYMPAIPARLVGGENIFSVIRNGDLLLQHPYDSFDPIVQFIRQAANDPRVLAIKQTLYRVSGKSSPVLAALVDAAESGKQVAVVIEVKARFDEEKNIELARRLERVGAHVVYSSPALKTHAKIALVVREEDDGLRRYVHIGTGNYNEKTARVYTDLSLFSCDPSLGADATQLFNAMTGYSRDDAYERFLVAPHGLRSALLDLIDREAAHARAGRTSGIIAKMNTLSDPEIVRALYRASMAGVPIDLVIRGMCILRPGVPGVSETIRVRSIVGRFLEHSRVFVFANDDQREVYIGSADWMSRNLDRRIELVIPVKTPHIADDLADRVMALLLKDNMQARILSADGIYERLIPASEEETVSAQSEFLRRAVSGAI